MKKFLTLVFIFSIIAACLQAQMLNPVTWSYTAKKTGDKTYELHITASIDPNWHIYAQEAGEGPEPTSFIFANNPLVKLDGKTTEDGELEKTYDPNFKSTLKYYAGKVDFIQKVKLKSAVATIVKGTITYMVCDDKKCLPPKEIPFSIKVPGK